MNNNQSQGFHQHSKKKMVITASILIAAVPGAAIALSTSSHSEGVKSSSISVHAFSSNPAASIYSEKLSPDVSTTSPTGSAHTNDSSNSMIMTVNGQNIAIPENGSTSETVPGTNGAATVNVSHTGTSNNSSSVSTQITTNSSTTGTGGFSNSYSNVNMYSNN